MAFKLVIGDKNLSSWSLRPWLALKQAGIPFEEINVRLRQVDSPEVFVKYSPSARVPVLLTAEGPVWDSLAICEYLADCFPEKNLWPADRYARAVARSVSAEMHSGFQSLRNEMPMDVVSTIEKPTVSEATLKDIARIQAMWRECREKFGGNGDFLFGNFTIADAMYAPVVTRFLTYGVKLDDVPARYCAAIMALPPMKEWVSGAKAEVKRIADQG